MRLLRLLNRRLRRIEAQLNLDGHTSDPNGDKDA